jgi:hypothetical protein
LEYQKFKSQDYSPVLFPPPSSSLGKKRNTYKNNSGAIEKSGGPQERNFFRCFSGNLSDFVGHLTQHNFTKLQQKLIKSFKNLNFRKKEIFSGRTCLHQDISEVLRSDRIGQLLGGGRQVDHAQGFSGDRNSLHRHFGVVDDCLGDAHGLVVSEGYEKEGKEVMVWWP